MIGFLAAKAITHPIDMLTRTARSIAQRDFTQRAEIHSRTEIGELAATFNQMAEDIQRYIGNLKMASEQNRQLFIDSIEMIAAAVDAKDPYTKGPFRARGAILRNPGARDWDCRKRKSIRSASPPPCTTSARSASKTACSRSRAC